MKFNNMGEQIKKINPLIEVPYKDHFSTVAGGDGEGNLDCFNVNEKAGLWKFYKRFF